VLNSVGVDGYPRRTLLAGLTKERKRVFYEYAPVEGGKSILEELLKRYWEGLKEPLHLFPEISWPYAEACLTNKKPREWALEQARKAWEGDGWNEREAADLYHKLCFAKETPIDSGFEDITLEVFELLLKYLEKK
jgi:exonuclease V gamma subunit